MIRYRHGLNHEGYFAKVRDLFEARLASRERGSKSPDNVMPLGESPDLCFIRHGLLVRISVEITSGCG